MKVVFDNAEGAGCPFLKLNVYTVSVIWGLSNIAEQCMARYSQHQEAITVQDPLP